NILFTFGLTTFAWIFFRAESISHALNYIGNMIGGFNEKSSYIQTYLILIQAGYQFILLLFLFIMVEWVGREHQYAIARIGSEKRWYWRYAMYYLIIIAIVGFGAKEQQFIYFQF